MLRRNTLLALLYLLTFLAYRLSAQTPTLPHGNNLNMPHSATRTSANRPIDMKSDPCFRDILNNDRARVFTVVVPAMRSTDLDIHARDYIILSLGKSNFQLGGGALRYPMQLDDGEMQVMKGGWPQRATNLADTTMRLVEVEIARDIHPEHPICGLAGRECVDGKFGGAADGTFTRSTLFETNTVKLSRLELGPGGLQPEEHYDRGHILLALNDVQLDDGSAGGSQITLKAGEAKWYPAITHQLKNSDHADAKLIVIELK